MTMFVSHCLLIFPLFVRFWLWLFKRGISFVQKKNESANYQNIKALNGLVTYISLLEVLSSGSSVFEG